MPLLLSIVCCTPSSSADNEKQLARQQSVSDQAVAVISPGSTWAYWDRDGVPSANWQDQDYDDRAWLRGAGPLGYGETYQHTTLSNGPSASEKRITAYFRRNFTLGAVSPAVVRGQLMYDDGVVVYLNGVPIDSIGMPDGPVQGDTLAVGHETGNNYETFDWSDSRELLVDGENTIAVEVHQHSRTSSDLMFDLALEVEAGAPTSPSSTVVVAEVERANDWRYWDLGGTPGAGWNENDHQVTGDWEIGRGPLGYIARGSEWLYWDRGQTPDCYGIWRGVNYDDSHWSTGGAPLGYGETYIQTAVSYGKNPSNKYITTYFRHWFEVSRPTINTTLTGELLYDDGAMVYLNGHLLERLAMPAGSVNHDTLSTGHETGAYERFDWTAARRHLEPGANVIAVEVHQLSRGSSDLAFDLALEVHTPAGCAVPGCGNATAPLPDADFEAVWAGAKTVWTAADDGSIGRRDDSGTWCWCNPDPDATWRGIWGAADDDVWVVGDGGRVRHFDGGELRRVDPGTNDDLTAVWGSADDDILVVGERGTVRRYNGTSWSANDVDPSASLQSVWGLSANDVWIGGAVPAPYPGDPTYDGTSAVVYRASVDGTWSLDASFTRYYGFANFRAIHGTSSTDVWAAGRDHPAGAAASYSHVAHYDGTSWERVSINDDLAQGRFGGILVEPEQVFVTNAGSAPSRRFDRVRWHEDEPLTSGLLAVAMANGTLWAVGIDGAIVRRDGSAWSTER